MQQATNPKTRLFSPESLVADSELWLDKEQAKYLTRVLRLREKDELLVFDGNGGHYEAVVSAFAGNRVLIQVGRHRSVEVESPLAIHLLQGISRGGRMDVVIQKATELGVRRITPVLTEFSVVKLDQGRAASRHQHWLKIAQSACEQCGRNTPPEIATPQKLIGWLGEKESGEASRIMLDTHNGASVSSMQKPNAGVEMLVGPEGGLSEGERQRCEEAGFRAVSLGPRILRTETAALAGVAVLQSLWGDLG